MYTIRNKKDNALIYFDSTAQPLFNRCHEHKMRFSYNNTDNKLYQKIRVSDKNDWYLELC